MAFDQTDLFLETKVGWGKKFKYSFKSKFPPKIIFGGTYFHIANCNFPSQRILLYG